MKDNEETSKYKLWFSLDNQTLPDPKYIFNQFPNLRYLSLKNDNIEEIPLEIRLLQHLEELDITGNPLKNVVDGLKTLKQLKKLRRLHIDINLNLIPKIKSLLPQLQQLNGQQLYTSHQRALFTDWEPINPSIEAQHLREISDIFQFTQTIIYQNHNQDSNTQFRKVIQQAFQNLSQNLSITRQQGLRAMLISKSRVQIQRYCLQMILKSFKPANWDVKILLEWLLRMQWKEFSQMQKIVFYQSKIRIDQEALMKSNLVTGLKKQIIELKEEVDFLSSRVNDLDEENKTYLGQLISYSKGNLQVLNNFTFDANYKNAKSIPYSAPVKVPQKKMLGLRQVEDMIIDIYDKKAKHQIAANKKTTIVLFLKTYFNMRFSLQSAAQNQLIFKQSLAIQTARKLNSTILFSKILHNQCEQEYIGEQKTIVQNLTKKIKSFLRDNQEELTFYIQQLEPSVFQQESNKKKTDKDIKKKQQVQISCKKISYEELDKIFDPKSKKTIGMDVAGMRTFLKQIMGSDEQIDYILDNALIDGKYDGQNTTNRSMTIPIQEGSASKQLLSRMNSIGSTEEQPIKTVCFKRVINIILNFYLMKHLQKIQKYTGLFKQVDKNNDGIIQKSSFIQFFQKCFELGYSWLNIESFKEKRVLVYSEFIQMTKAKPKKKVKSKQSKISQ